MTEKLEPKPSHKGLYSALAAAQAEMGRALKDTNNPHFKSKYADLASVCDACMPALSKHGIAVLQPPFDDETGRYVKTIFVHGESGETFECRVPLIVAKTDMQGYGSAVTYARRYGLMGMAGIAPEDDDGNAAAKSPPKVEPPRQEKNAAPISNERPASPDISSDAVDAAISYLGGAEDFPHLQRLWSNIPKEIKLHSKVAAAKDAAKISLTPAQVATPNADLGSDGIPY